MEAMLACIACARVSESTVWLRLGCVQLPVSCRSKAGKKLLLLLLLFGAETWQQGACFRLLVGDRSGVGSVRRRQIEVQRQWHLNRTVGDRVVEQCQPELKDYFTNIGAPFFEGFEKEILELVCMCGEDVFYVFVWQKCR